MTERQMIAAALARARAEELAAVLRLARKMEDAHLAVCASLFSCDQRTKEYQSSLIHLNRAGALRTFAETLEKGEHIKPRRVRKPKQQEAAS
jgi:hypothetical protein